MSSVDQNFFKVHSSACILFALPHQVKYSSLKIFPLTNSIYYIRVFHFATFSLSVDQQRSSMCKGVEAVTRSSREKMLYLIKIFFIVSLVLFKVSLLGALLLSNSSVSANNTSARGTSGHHGDFVSNVSRPLPRTFRRGPIFHERVMTKSLTSKSSFTAHDQPDKADIALRKCEGLYLMQMDRQVVFVHQAIESVCLVQCIVFPIKNISGTVYYDQSMVLNTTLNENKPCDSNKVNTNLSVN